MKNNWCCYSVLFKYDYMKHISTYDYFQKQFYEIFFAYIEISIFSLFNFYKNG